jgi:phenylacetate-CoA ligase
MVTVRGVNLYPSQVEEIVRRHPEVTEFVIELRRERSMDEATLLLEMDADASGVPATIADELRLALGARIECRRVAPGTLPRAELKSKRLMRVAS